MLSLEKDDIEAFIYHCDAEKDRYYARITFLGIGLFLNSFSVMPSRYEGQEYWVQPPKQKTGVAWKTIAEFDRSYPLWDIIEQKILEAVKHYKSDMPLPRIKDVVVEDIPDDPITLDDIPF